jgi:hypothetical protein
VSTLFGAHEIWSTGFRRRVDAFRTYMKPGGDAKSVEKSLDAADTSVRATSRHTHE